MGRHRPGQELHHYGDAIYSAAFNPDSKTILTVTGGNTARLRDTTRPRNKGVEGHGRDVRSVTFSPDNKTLVITGCGDVDEDEWCISGTAGLWDAATGQELRQLPSRRDPVNSTVFSSDSKTVVTISDDDTTRLWDAATGQELYRLKGHLFYAFSPDGKAIITAGDDQHRSLLWDTAIGQEVHQLAGPHGLLSTPPPSARMARTVVTTGDDHHRPSMGRCDWPGIAPAS